MDTSSRTQMAEVLGKHWRSCGTSRTKFIWTPIGRIVVGKNNSRKFYWLGWEEVPNWDVFLIIGNKDYSYRYTWTTSKWLERGRMWLPCARNWWNTWILVNPQHFLITYTWDVLNMKQTESNHYWGIHIDVWITYFCWSNWEVTRMRKTSRKNSRVVLRHGRTCSKMRREILRAGKQKSGAAPQSFKSLLGWSSTSNRKNLDQLENYHKFAHRLFLKLFVLVTNWKTRHSVVCQQTCKSSHKNGLRHTTDDWQDWFHTFTTQNEFRQYCRLGNTAQHCRLGFFQDSDFAGDLEDSKSNSGGVLQTSVSHSSTESDIISLDAGQRMDGRLALDLWDRGNLGVAFNKQHQKTN